MRKIRDGAAVGEEQESGLAPPNLRKNKYTRNERPHGQASKGRRKSESTRNRCKTVSWGVDAEERA